MQEEYQRRLEQEIQRYISENSTREGIGSSLAVKEAEDKIISQKKALETAKQMLHQGRGEAESPEMDWDYYVVHDWNWGTASTNKSRSMIRVGQKVGEKNFRKELLLCLWRGNLALEVTVLLDFLQ